MPTAPPRRAILAHTQRLVCKCCCVADVEPDQLESWSLTQEGTVGVASTADGTARYTSAESTRCALGTKRVVPSVPELLKASCKTCAPVPRGATVIAFAEQVAVECTDTNNATAEALVTAAAAGAARGVEAGSACGDIVMSPDMHIPLEELPRRRTPLVLLPIR